MSDEIEILGLGPDGLRLGLAGTQALAPTSLLAREMDEVTADGAAEWAAALQSDLATAISALAAGRTPAAPFEALVLTGEA